jgi:hypothetical protein
LTDSSNPEKLTTETRKTRRALVGLSAFERRYVDLLARGDGMARSSILLLGALIGGAAMALLQGGLVSAGAEKADARAWQYRAAGSGGSLEPEELRKLGEDGWELVCVDRSGVTGVTFYFKKPR